jgi:hypothetical protein
MARSIGRWRVELSRLLFLLSEEYRRNQPTRATFRADYDDEKGYFVMDLSALK